MTAVPDRRCDGCIHWRRGWRGTKAPWAWVPDDAGSTYGACYGVPPTKAVDGEEGNSFPHTHEDERCPRWKAAKADAVQCPVCRQFIVPGPGVFCPSPPSSAAPCGFNLPRV